MEVAGRHCNYGAGRALYFGCSAGVRNLVPMLVFADPLRLLTVLSADYATRLLEVKAPPTRMRGALENRWHRQKK